MILRWEIDVLNLLPEGAIRFHLRLQDGRRRDGQEFLNRRCRVAERGTIHSNAGSEGRAQDFVHKVVANKRKSNPHIE